MSSFTENLYLKRMIQQLQEENLKLKSLLNEIDSFEADRLRDEHASLHHPGSGFYTPGPEYPSGKKPTYRPGPPPMETPKPYRPIQPWDGTKDPQIDLTTPPVHGSYTPKKPAGPDIVHPVWRYPRPWDPSYRPPEHRILPFYRRGPFDQDKSEYRFA